MARFVLFCFVIPFVLSACHDKVPSRCIGVVDVPDSLQDVKAKQCFVALHFWDGVQSGDTLFFHDMNVSDSLFQKYVALVSKLPNQMIENVLMRCISLLEQNGQALSAVDDSRERILQTGGTEKASYDNLNRIFLKTLLTRNVGDGYQKKRWRDELKMLSQNRPNGYANNFIFYGIANKSQSMASFFEGKGGVLLFFNPDCEACDNALAIMESQRDNLLKRVKVLAVYIGGDSDVWRSFSKKEHPKWITWAWDKGQIFKSGSYLLRRMPSFYVVSPKGKVQLYDGSVEDLLTYMGKAKERRKTGE